MSTLTDNQIKITIENSQSMTTNLAGRGPQGVGLEYNWNGTELGIKTENETEYTYSNLKGDQGDVGPKGDKGDKGDAGSVKFIIVSELPSEGDDTAIYLVPSTNPETQNVYDEFIYTGSGWEQLGSTPIEVDLTNYYTKSQVNTIKDNIEAEIPTKTSDITNDSDYTTKAYVDSLVGDIESALNEILGDDE